MRKNDDGKVCLNYVQNVTKFEKLEFLPATCQELAAPIVRNDHASISGTLQNFENFELYAICQGCDRRVDKNNTSCQQKSCRYKGESFQLKPQVGFGFNIIYQEEKTSPHMQQREILKINTNTDALIDGHLGKLFKVETITKLRQCIMRDCDAAMNSPQAMQYTRIVRQMIQFWLQMVMKYCAKSPVKLVYNKKAYGSVEARANGRGQKYVNKIVIDYHNGFPPAPDRFTAAEQIEQKETMKQMTQMTASMG